MPNSTTTNRLEHHQRIISALAAAEGLYHVRPAKAGRDGDVAVELQTKRGPPRTLRFTCHRVAPPAAYTLEAYILRGALESTAGGRDVPALALWAQRLTSAVASRLEAFIEKHARSVNIIIISDRGGVVASLPALKLRFTRADAAILRESDSHRASASAGGAAFTDKDQWLLKHLIYQQPGEVTWWGKRTGRITTTAQWIEAAGTGSTTVYRLRDRLIARHILDGSKHGRITLASPERLLEDWLGQARIEFPTTLAVMPIFGAGKEKPPFIDRLSWLRKHIGHRDRQEYAVSGWAAIQLHGMSHVVTSNDRAIEISVRESIVTATIDYQFTPCQPKEAWFTIVDTHYPTSVFSSSINLDDVWVADLWQSALDVAHDPARGYEQSEFLKETILNAARR